MIPLVWWALGFLFASSAPAFPAGNLASLTRAIAALRRRLDRPVRSPTPQGPKGSVQGPGMPPPAASDDTIYKGCLVSNPSMGCQCCDSVDLTFIYSHRTKIKEKNCPPGFTHEPIKFQHFCRCSYLFLKSHVFFLYYLKPALSFNALIFINYI